MKYLKRFNESVDKTTLKNCISYISDEYDIDVQYSDVFLVYKKSSKNAEIIDPADYEVPYNFNNLQLGRKSYPIVKITISNCNKDVMSKLKNMIFNCIKSEIDNVVIFTEIKFGTILFDNETATQKVYHGLRTKNKLTEFYISTDDISDIIEMSEISDSFHKKHKSFTIL